MSRVTHNDRGVAYDVLRASHHARLIQDFANHVWTRASIEMRAANDPTGDPQLADVAESFARVYLAAHRWVCTLSAWAECDLETPPEPLIVNVSGIGPSVNDVRDVVAAAVCLREIAQGGIPFAPESDAAPAGAGVRS